MVFSLVMILAGRWQDRAGPRVVAFSGGLVLAAGYALGRARRAIVLGGAAGGRRGRRRGHRAGLRLSDRGLRQMVSRLARRDHGPGRGWFRRRGVLVHQAGRRVGRIDRQPKA